MSKKEIIILAVLLALVLAAGAAVALISAGNQPQVIINEFVPPAFEQGALAGVPGELPMERGYGTLALREDALVSMCSNVLVSDGIAQLYVTSAATNRCWLKVKVLAADGTLLGESGLLRPGEYVPGVVLAETPKTGTLVTVRILLYEPETYVSAGAASAQVCILEE